MYITGTEQSSFPWSIYRDDPRVDPIFQLLHQLDATGTLLRGGCWLHELVLRSWISQRNTNSLNPNKVRFGKSYFPLQPQLSVNMICVGVSDRKQIRQGGK